jgi:hypothetical protein
MSTLVDTPEPRKGSRYRGSIVPYTTRWSTEEKLPTNVIERRGSGIAYADEILSDRDDHGVLWQRVRSRPGAGRPEFGKVHPARQKHAMRDLLCQVCAAPADHTGLGTLWLIPDYPGYHVDWPGWPEGLATPEPPICLPCAHTATRACPALRKDHVAIRVGHSLVSGVRGIRYRRGPLFLRPADEIMIAYHDPAITWTCAAHLVRELFHCTIVNLEKGPD